MRGRATRGRARAKARARQQKLLGSTPLLLGQDHGAPVRVEAEHVDEVSGNSAWPAAFLEANRELIRRLDLIPAVRSDRRGPRVELSPSARIGAIPLLAPSTRRVAAGLVVRPRFGWSATGSVLAQVDFRVEPHIGGTPLVPGSAREVPPWILAGPVLRRLRRLLAQLSRDFDLRTDVRSSPRGTVDWNHYARHLVPTGQWAQFRCTFPDLVHDPALMSRLRWTLGRLRADLERLAGTAIGQLLLREAQALQADLGPGPSERPELGFGLDAGGGMSHGALVEALEAIAWVAEERGLGGARVLDGLAWSLGADRVWEAWVEAFLLRLSQRIGARLLGRRETRRRLRWQTRLRSMGSLEPDLGLLLGERTVWVDAKYKFHLQRLRQRGWHGAGRGTREAHRADLHQALAYAALADTPVVDTILVYPLPGLQTEPVMAVAQVPAGRRKLRLVLCGMPFGVRGVAGWEGCLEGWEGVLGRARR